MDINITIGRNIRLVRTVRRMTMQQLAIRLNEIGYTGVTGHTVGNWERGDVKVTAEQMLAISKALVCSVAQLYYGDQYLSDIRLLHEIQALPDTQREILMFCITSWTGDVHALINFMGLFASFQEHERAQIAQEGLHFLRKAQRSGSSLMLPIDVDLLRQKTKELEN